MKYFVKGQNGRNILINMISLSPTGKYFVARTDGYTVFKITEKDDEDVYGTAVTSGVDYSDEDGFPVRFSGVEWFEEYGFVKIVFSNWDTFERESARFYLDRELYERKKQELHGK